MEGIRDQENWPLGNNLDDDNGESAACVCAPHRRLAPVRCSPDMVDARGPAR